MLSSALYRDESKPFRLRDAQSSRSSIDIYSCSGKQINRINVRRAFPWISVQDLTRSQWEQATIRGLGWSDKEELLIVSEDGTVRRYFGLDGEFTSFSLGNVETNPGPPHRCLVSI